MQTFQTRIEADGKIQLPQQILDELEFVAGDEVELEIEKKSFRVSATRSEKLKRAKALVREFVKSDVSLADELIEDRRREVEND